MNSIAFSPDGKTLAMSTAENSVDLYEASSGNLVRKLAGCKVAGPSAFSRDGKWLATKSEKNIRIWDAQTGKLFQILTGHSDTVVAVAFSPDGELLGSADGAKSLKLWDPQTGKMLHTMTGLQASLVDVAFSPDGKTLAGADGSTLRLWDRETRKLKLQVESSFPASDTFPAPVRSITFSPSGKMLAIASYDNTFNLLDVETGKPKYSFKQNSQPWAAAFSPDEKTVVSACEPKTLYFWSLETAELQMKIGNEARSDSVAFSPDGQTIASGGGFYSNAISLWDARTGKPLRTLTGHESAMKQIAFSPDGKVLAGTVESSSNLYLWDVKTGELLRTVAVSADPYSIDFSPDGKVLASGGGYDDGSLKLLDIETGKPRRALSGSAIQTALNPLTKKMESKRRGVSAVRFSPDGATLAAAVDDGSSVKVWNARTGVLLRRTGLQEREDYGSAFSPDLGLLASSGGAEPTMLEIWDTAKGVLRFGLEGHDEPVVAVAFSPDGKTLASGSLDRTVKVWDVGSGKLIRTLAGHGNSVNAVAFSPDGKTLLSGSADGTVRLWDVQTGEVKEISIL
jgi:WD40 repeat protein